MGTTIPNVPPQFFDDNGAVVPGGLLNTYEAGTTTPLATYSDVDLTVANTNPIVLDASGRATIFLQKASYKFVLTDAAGNTIWTRDNILANALFNIGLDITGTAGETISTGELVYLSDGGGSLTAGRWYLADADNTYSSNAAPVMGFAQEGIATGSEGSIRLSGRVTGLSGLTAGTPYYASATAGALTATAPTNARIVALADSTTSVVTVFTESSSYTTGPLPAIDGSALLGIQKFYDVKTTSTGNVGAGEDVLETIVIAADTLNTNGDTVHGDYWGNNANNANAKTIRLSLKDSDDDTEVLSVTMPTSEATLWRLVFTFMRSAAGTFQSEARIVGGPSAAAATVNIGNVTTGNTITWSDTVTIEITGEATANNDIQLDGGVTLLTAQG